MPYAIRETDDCDYEVYDEDTDKAVGCAGSKAKAEAMIRALDEADAEDDGGGDGKGLDGSGPAEDIKCIPFEIKASGKESADGSGSNYLEGIGGAFHNLDLTGDIIAPGAFKDSLDRFLSVGVLGGLNHDWNNPIGHPVEARETPEGLYIKAVLDDSDDARNALAKMKINPASGRATIRRLSIGYKARDAQPLGPDEVRGYWAAHGYAPDALEVKALQSRKGARLLKRVDLYEISPVTVPANDRAVILAAKCGMGMPYGPGPGGGLPTLDDATDRVRDSIVAVFQDYLMMANRVTVANDMVSPDDRLAIVGQNFDQTRDATIQYLRPILTADDSDDAIEDITDTLDSLSKSFHVGLEAAGMDIDRKVLFAVPASGSDFTSHSRLVVSASDEYSASIAAYVKRAEDKDEARFKVGRTFSQAHVDEIDSVADSIESSARTHLGHAARLRALTAKAKDKRTPAGTFPVLPAASGTVAMQVGGKGQAASAEADATHEGTEVKGVVPYASGPVLDASTWDGAAADGRVRAWAGGPGKDAIDWGKYTKAFAYVDPGDGDGSPADFGAYHLLHHDVADGSLKVSRRGVFAAAVIIQGGRGGGADFVKHIGPQATAGVKAHLGKHYSADLDMPAPWDRQKAGLYPEEIEATGVTEAELKALGWAALPAPEGVEPGTEAKSAPVPHEDVARSYADFIETIRIPALRDLRIGR